MLKVAARDGMLTGMSAPPATRAHDPLILSMLCDYVSEGTPLLHACDTLGLNVRTVYGWIERDAEFRADMEAARAIGYDRIAEDILRIADDISGDEATDGRGNRKMDAEFVQRSRVKIDARRWLLSKWHRNRYGDKLEVETTNRTASYTLSDDPNEAAKQYADLIGER